MSIFEAAMKPAAASSHVHIVKMPWPTSRWSRWRRRWTMKLLQNPLELSQFIALLNENNVRSYLEIGSKKGGSFGPIVMSLPARSRAVSVDLPFPPEYATKHYLPWLKQCCSDLKQV